MPISPKLSMSRTIPLKNPNAKTHGFLYIEASEISDNKTKGIFMIVVSSISDKKIRKREKPII